MFKDQRSSRHLAPGGAFQFDWSYEYLELGVACVKLKVAHIRLCHRRMPFCVAYTRETLEMAMDAHVRAIEVRSSRSTTAAKALRAPTRSRFQRERSYRDSSHRF